MQLSIKDYCHLRLQSKLAFFFCFWCVLITHVFSRSVYFCCPCSYKFLKQEAYMYLLDYHIIRHSVTDWKSREMEERAKAPYLNILYQLVPNCRDSSSTFDARCMSIFQGLHLHHRQNTSQHSARLPGAKVSNQTFRGTCSNCWWASVDAKLTASKLTDMLQKVSLLSPLYMKAHHSSSHNYRFRPSSSRAVAMQWPRTAVIIGAYA